MAIPAPAASTVPVVNPAAPALSSSFDTTTTDTNVTNTGGFLFSPADPIGAAGPDHLVNVVNVTIRFHQKDGTLDFDDNLAAFGFSGSAATTQVGSHYTTHLPTTAAGGNTGSGTLRSGVAYYRRTFTCGTVSRWGDYSGMAVDPLDGCFWVYNKHAISRGTATTDCEGDPDPDEDGRWGTAFGKFCPGGACPPDLRVEGAQYTTTVTEEAGGQILTDGNVTVGSAADVTFQAGQRIVLADGFNVESGGSFTATISPCP